MLITNFICTVTVYNKHLNETISWDGIFKSKLFYPKQNNILQMYSGCAIRNRQNVKLAYENDILSYTECMLSS